ncbi:MAG: DNA internalization-related competence protein ComEC/Rec2 [Cellvibrionaceae bacterium]
MSLPIAILCTVIGILSVSMFPNIHLPYHLSFIVPLCSSFLFFFFSCYLSSKFYPRIQWLKKIRFLGFCFIGIFWGVYCGHIIVGQQLDHELEGQDFLVEGIVSDLPEDKVRYQRFLFSLDEVLVGEGLSKDIAAKKSLREKIDNHILPKTLLLSWYGGEQMSVGDRWRLKIKLKRPRGSVNEGGFDYQRWLLSQGIGATGYVKKSSYNIFIGSTLEYSTNQIRELIRDWLRNILYENESSQLLTALAIGDNSFISQKQWDLLRSTGTSHLMAISGLHIGLIATFGFWFGILIRALLSLRFSFTRIIYYFPTLFSVLFAVCYAALAGFALPTQRALIMVVVANIALVIHRRVGSFLPFLWALLIVVTLDPLAGYELGFWLSFSAVGSLLYAFSYRSEFSKHKSLSADKNVTERSSNVSKKIDVMGVVSKAYHGFFKWVSQLNRSQWVVFIGLFLPLFLLNQSSSYLSPIANFFAIPWVSFTVVIPLLLAMFFHLMSLLCGSFVFIGEVVNTVSFFLVSIADANMAICTDFLLWLRSFVSPENFNFIYNQEISSKFKSPKGLVLILYLLLAIFGVILLLAPKGIPFKWLGLFLVVPLFFSRPFSQISFMHDYFFDNSLLIVSVLDVGQGLAVVVQTKNKTLLYDTGPGNSDGFNAGQSIILPFLDSQSIDTVDTLIVSHNDNDHAGGMISLLKSKLKVKQFIYGEEATLFSTKSFINNKRQENFVCDKDLHWQWDDIDFYLLEPKGLFNKKDKNNQSCVLMISFEDQHILIPGDVERSVEQALLRDKQLPSDISLLIAPHHGSQTSSTAGFVNYLKPNIVVFSAGYNSRYGHPHPKVVQRYSRIKSDMFNTGEMGQLQFRFEINGVVTSKQWRKDHQRYWFGDD